LQCCPKPARYRSTLPASLGIARSKIVLAGTLPGGLAFEPTRVELDPAVPALFLRHRGSP
jgi:hypothetical protein